MRINFILLVISMSLFRIITFNLLCVALMAIVRFYRHFYRVRENILYVIVNIQVPIYKTLMPKNKRWHYSKNDLLQFPEGTLGKDVGYFLETNKFDFIPFLETHDIYHVLFGYKTTIADEARMYFFLLGNRNYS